MIINVGSANPTKVAAVSNLFIGHRLFPDTEVKGIPVEVEEFGHPKTLKDVIGGAKRRALQAFKDCSYSIGLESGIFPVADAKSGYFETTACAIYDGHQYHLGLSPSFEWPSKMIELILKGYDGSQAFKMVGLTDHQKIGVAEGGIHVLTGAKLNRTELNELAIMMALIHIENAKDY